jgi:hypothetical protein
LQDVELTGTNRPCGLTANLKPIQMGLRGDDGYRDRRWAVARIEDCQSISLTYCCLPDEAAAGGSLLIQLVGNFARPWIRRRPPVRIGTARFPVATARV